MVMSVPVPLARSGGFAGSTGAAGGGAAGAMAGTLGGGGGQVDVPFPDDGGPADHVVLHVDDDLSVLAGGEIGEEMPQVGTVELA
jgi:hypothetical protein